MFSRLKKRFAILVTFLCVALYFTSSGIPRIFKGRTYVNDNNSIEQVGSISYSIPSLSSITTSTTEEIISTSTTTRLVTPKRSSMVTIDSSSTKPENNDDDNDDKDENEGCPFQQVDPFDPKNEKYIAYINTPINCTKGLPFIVYIDNENKLQINWTKVNATIGNLDYCKYTRVAVAQSDDEDDSDLRIFDWSQPFLNTSLQLTDEDEHVWAQCYLNDTVVSQTFKSRVLLKPKVEERCETNYKKHVEENSPSETLSVLIIGMDGMSKQNFARTMPKTRQFIINNLNAKELNKFNKVGDNTFPNVIAFHTGHRYPYLMKFWNKTLYLDVLEDKFIWHHYQKAGYRTAMGFDATDIAVYHYLKRGFKHPTFDYYNRALRLLIDKEAKIVRKASENCVGEVPELHIMMDYVTQMVSLFNGPKTSRPYFIYNFYNTITHYDQEQAGRVDNIYSDFFQELHEKRVLNNTITIFFSDHGARFNRFRDSFNGKVEINTPPVFFMFPPWFEKKYPEVMKTFQTNQDRLTTFMDLHETLMGLLKFNGKTQKGSLDSKAISLFDEIPMDRNCRHADIPPEYCNCKTLSKETVLNSVSGIVSEELVNAIVNKTNDYRDRCALLILKSVNSVLMLMNNGTDVPYYKVSVETEPGGGQYEALVNYDEKSGNAPVIVGHITRLNLYKGQDGCVELDQLKLYCYCK